MRFYKSIVDRINNEYSYHRGSYYFSYLQCTLLNVISTILIFGEKRN